MKQSAAEHFRKHLVAKEIADSPLAQLDSNRRFGKITSYLRPAGGLGMNTKELCDLLEIKDTDKQKVKTELCVKLSPIIMRFNADYPTASIFAKPKGRSERELKYLEQKGLVYLHGKSQEGSNIGAGSLYKLTNKGVEAYRAYIAFTKK
jgi:hypothetical protein